MTTDALFEPTADGYRATENVRGPWDPGAAHGGPVAALVGHIFERHGDTSAFFTARVTLELLRPVPIGELRAEVVERRPGRKVQLLDLHLHAGGKEVATARSLRIRRAEVELPELPRPAAGSKVPPPPETGRSPHFVETEGPAFHRTGSEVLMVGDGDFSEPGPGTAWVRLRMPVVADSEPTPLVRALAAADYGNGVSSVLPVEEYLFINPDLSVYLDRDPVGEWICLESETVVEPLGTGITKSALRDARGPIGIATQALFVDRR